MARPVKSLKRHKQSLKKRERNFSLRSKLKTTLKSARAAIDTKSENALEKVAGACRELDRMATKGLIKKENASRRKSRLMKAYNATQKSE
ncbi:MAG TPA: 30S ribosomal protein S20 [bacterium]